MRAFATVMTASVLIASVLVAACTGAGSPAATPAPTMTTPAPPTGDPTTPAATATPRAKPMLIPAKVTFDGTTCTYLGPTVVPLGSVIEWTFETTATTAEERASWELLAWDLTYDATWDDIVAWAAEHTFPQEPPYTFAPWAIECWWWTVDDLPARKVVDLYPVLVGCGVGAGDLVNGERMIPAGLIRAIKG